MRACFCDLFTAAGTANAKRIRRCRSRDRREKEQAMHARFEKRTEEELTKIAAGCLNAEPASCATKPHPHIVPVCWSSDS